MITLFEDYWNTVPDLESYLPAFKKLAEVVGEGHVSLQVDGRVQITRYVGFFQYQNTRIQILPKVFAKGVLPSGQGSEIIASLEFVYRMLYWTNYSGFESLNPQLQNASGGDLLEIFIGIFIREFTRLFRQKVHRNYVHEEENQSFIKGKILVSETIRKNPVLKHLHYTRYDEYSLNNPLNQVFKALILVLLKKTRDANNKKKLVIGLTFLQDVDLVHPSRQIFQRVQFNRLNTEFEPLFNFARLFFSHQQPGLGSGTDKSLCFLVKMNILFEQYVGKALDSLNQNGLRFQYHNPQLYLDVTKQAFQLEPDFLLYSGDECLCILDAKYKYPFDKTGQVKINTNDLYQLATYALRYGSKMLVLVYPKFVGAPSENTVLSQFDLSTDKEQMAIQLVILQVDIQNNSLKGIAEALAARINMPKYL